VFVSVFGLALAVVGAQQVPPAAGQAAAQKTPPAPTGPLAPTEYTDVQIMKDVPVDQFDLTMDYFVVCVGLITGVQITWRAEGRPR
jgi:hypothetical protein